ncbi:hypothetical protein KSF78_0003336 [Schistosoma japonicum]|nr:hypothetical protein KSF78_0003336 [Schistosoma japonicum]
MIYTLLNLFTNVSNKVNGQQFCTVKSNVFYFKYCQVKLSSCPLGSKGDKITRYLKNFVHFLKYCKKLIVNQK